MAYVPFKANEIREMVIEKRLAGLSDQEIYDELKVKYEKYKLPLAKLIGRIAREKEIKKNETRNMFITILITLSFINSIIIFIIGFTKGYKFSVTFEIALLPMLLIFAVKSVNNYKYEAYKTLIMCSILTIVSGFQRLISWNPTIILILGIINIVLVIFIAALSSTQLSFLFPNSNPGKNKEGDYIFKE